MSRRSEILLSENVKIQWNQRPLAHIFAYTLVLFTIKNKMGFEVF